ncbi:MAG: hypothetical protein KC438_14635, partial [Thermomicrobiales bacterium]|nr:hypothetical protein [Thermomicrobiales bacterium]
AVQGGFKAIPVLAPLAGTQQALAYGDIQALTGARLLSPVAGDRVSRIEPAALGRAPRIVVGARFFNITSSDRQSVEIALRLRAIERVIEQTDDEQERRLHRLRYARLTQQLAVVWIGGPTGPDRDARVRQVRRTIDQLQLVQRAGVVPGGGATLLAIARRLRDEAVETGRSGLLAVPDGLDAPARWIAKNAGHDPGAMVHRLGPYVPERGLNVRTGQIVSLRETGVLDATSTLRAAITVGLSMANQASDCEALVLRQNELWQVQLTP